MDRLLNNIRLRNKMLLVYFLCVFAPIILTNAIFYNVITSDVRESRMKDIDRALEQIKSDFRLQIDDAVGLSSFFYTDLKTNDILERDFTNYADYMEVYDDYLRRVLNSYNPVAVSLQNMIIYVDNETLLHSGNIGFLSDDIRAEEWYKKGMSSERSQTVFIRTETKDGRFGTFSLLRKLDYFSDRMDKEKLLKLDFKTIDFIEIFSNLNVQGEIYLLNPAGNIEYTTNGDLDWQSSSKVSYDSMHSAKKIEIVKEYQGVNYLNGWQIVGTIDEAEIIKEVRKSRGFIIWSACLMMLIPTVFIVMMTRSINKRIVKILKHMKKVKSQNFEVIKNDEFTDEIGQLTLEFNLMILQLQSLIDDVYIADIQKKSLELERRKAQLNALQSQINPHFLFNALETIRMRSLLKHENETAKIIHSMAKIFRSSLTWNKDRITVKEELEFILCFLDIQKYRFEDKLDYRIDVEPEAYGFVVPKMVFLPFVENACIHGIEPLKQGGVLNIRIGLSDEGLVFAIQDNGIGIDEETVDKLYRYLNTDEIMGERIGIQNVIYRGKMIYGDRFSFTINSRPGKGTLIELKIPGDTLI